MIAARSATLITMGAKGGRVYSGVEVDERVAQRRSRLLEAGLDILGDPRGDDDLTLRVICRRSGLAQRYFYESFDDLDIGYQPVGFWERIMALLFPRRARRPSPATRAARTRR